MEELGLQGLVLIVLGCVVIGAGLGFLISHFIGGDKEEAAQKEAEAHEAYREEVHEHFEQTSQIMSRMVEDYRELYKHMSEGAGNLANIHPEKVITPPPTPEAITEQVGEDSEAANDTPAQEEPAQEEVVPAAADDEAAAQTQQADTGDTDAADDSEAHAETATGADAAAADDDNAKAATTESEEEEDASAADAQADAASAETDESEQERARRLSGEAPQRGGEKVGGI